MLCLSRQIISFRPIFHILTRRPLLTTIQWRALPVRTKTRWRNPTEIPSVRKKDVRRLRREQEKAEAKIPGTEGFLRAQRKAAKLQNKEARRARIAAGEPLTDEADIKAEEQAKIDREKLFKKRAEPVRRQARRDFKHAQREYATRTPEELERGFKIRRDGQRRQFPQTPLPDIPKSYQDAAKTSRIRSPDYKPRVYKTKEEYELERSQLRTKDSVKTHDDFHNQTFKYKLKEEKKWSSEEEAPKDFLVKHFDRTGGSTNPAERFSPRSDRSQYGTRDTANTRPWDGPSKGDERSSGRSDHRQDFNGHSDRSTGRASDRMEKTHSLNDRGDRSKAPFASRSRSDERYAKREPWMVQKEAVKRKIGGEAWAPPKRLSPDTLEAIRTMHKSDPDKFSTPILAQQFKQSPEVIRRILRTKWQPNEEEVLDRQERWERRGEKIWTKQAELGVRPPKKWREMGVANTGESGVAPRYKKNAHARDRSSDRPNHFVAQRRGAFDYNEAGLRKPFSERIL
ncbi:hypothetical protein EG328_011146 [Venturia inaequalis]|uniref:Required for respiratory growth protein 9, mitochondrial n=1 Tax=Venturia inaequalis TaxID=5025 RepID=A0A8H3VIH4_VENIN|nr:hypothetical protein EG328_011146 [Venturia inaequalis]RDI82015.1 hypothetical protein Vi05172_g7817 [Venturia inaequalis]